MQQDIDYTANLAAPAPAPRRASHFSRAKKLGLAGALVMVTAYFGTVVWVGQDLAASVKAGTREIAPGMMVPDSEG